MHYSLIIIVACFTSACSSATFYDAKRDRTASEALASFEEADFDAYSKARADRRTRLRDEHLAITSLNVENAARIAMTDLLRRPADTGLFAGHQQTETSPHWLGQPTKSSCETLAGIIAQRLCRLGIADSQDVELLNAAYEAPLEIYRLGIPAVQENLRAFLGARTPSCDDLRYLQTEERRAAFGETLIASLPADRRDIAKVAFDELVHNCSWAVQFFDAFGKRMLEKALQREAPTHDEACVELSRTVHETEIATVICDLWNADKDVVAAKAAIAAVAAELKATAVAAVETKPFNEEELRKALTKAKKRVDKIVEGGSAVVETIGLDGGATIAALDAISALLAAGDSEDASPSEDDDLDLKRARVLFASFQSLARKSGDVVNAQVDPVPAKLLIEREFLTIERDALRSRLALLEAGRALELRLLRASMGQAFVLALARQEKPKACPDSCDDKTPLSLIRSSAESKRRATYVALARVWIAITALEETRRNVPWEKSFLIHDEIGLERDQALAETRFLAGGGLEGLAAFYKTGLKNEEIAALIGRFANLALLGGILNATD